MEMFSIIQEWGNFLINYVIGDQQLTSQNKTLAESNKNGVAIYLCEVLESGKYIFHGRVQLVQDPFQQDQKDSEGMLRKVWIFPVKVVLFHEKYTFRSLKPRTSILLHHFY